MVVVVLLLLAEALQATLVHLVKISVFSACAGSRTRTGFVERAELGRSLCSQPLLSLFTICILELSMFMKG